MKTICSLCRKDICETAPISDKVIKYAVCDECHNIFKEKIRGKTIDNLINEFATPVLIVDEDCRIVTANRPASTIAGLGPSKRDYIGLLGGEAMQCEYADLPEGCGRTYHCAGCAIRNAVKDTMESGDTQKDIPVILKRKTGDINIWVSTEKIFSMVRISIKTDFIPSKQGQKPPYANAALPDSEASPIPG
jgi:hypothetical protein